MGARRAPAAQLARAHARARRPLRRWARRRSMRTLAILPVKRFELAKTRLGEALAPRARRARAGDGRRRARRAARGAAVLDGVAVVTNEPAVAALARDARRARARRPARVRPERRGARRASPTRSPAATSACCSCPATARRSTATRCEALLARPPAAPSVTIVADRHGAGTNALLLAPPDAIEPGFGPGSFERHRAARAARPAPPGASPRCPACCSTSTPPRTSRALRGALADAGPAHHAPSSEEL